MEFERVSEREWEEIVLKSDDAYFFHSPTWAKILEKTYDYRAATRLYHMNDKSILIPMMQKNAYEKNAFGFKSFDSMPYGYGGFFPDFDVSSDELGRIVGDIVGGRNLSFNLTLPPNVNIASPGRELGTEIKDEWNYIHILNLDGKDFENISKNYNKNQKRNIRKAIKSGVEIREGTSLDDYKAYYNIYLGVSQGWGYENPEHPYNFWSNLYKYGSPHVKLSLAMKDDLTIGGLVSFHYAKKVHFWLGITDDAYRSFSPSSLLYNNSIEQACLEDYEYINFGPSAKDGGLMQFKEGFGAEEIELKRYRVSSIFSRVLSKVNETLRIHRPREG